MANTRSIVLLCCLALSTAFELPQGALSRDSHLPIITHGYEPNSQVPLGRTHGLMPGYGNSSANYWLGGIDHTQSKSIYDSYVVYRNVKDFGTKGDGFTDDTSAIQNAITCMSNAHFTDRG